MEERLTNFMEELYPSLQECRRDFHKYAETGWVEFRTVRIVASKLSAWGYKDATYMMERVNQKGGLASYLLFGTTLAAGHHHEKFAIDEQVLSIGVKTLTFCALCASEL